MGNGDASKRYGSGRTAAEVARENGVTSGMLHGPGNSQPHKMALCPGGHEVDVHALKAKGQQNACAAAVTTPTSKVTPTSTVTTVGIPTKGAAVSASVAGGVQGAAASGAAPSGGVLGVTASGKGAPAGGVLGAIAAVGEGVLPFTGFPLWVALLLAVGLAGTGLALRRHARATV
jgi:hypothetical protein